MSNRCYLYSINFVPGEDTEDRRIVGISEWAYDIPIAFKTLLSANPHSCRSLIFEKDEDRMALAVIGDYDRGVRNLLQFLERVPHPLVPALADEAKEFLQAAGNKNRYFLLEPGEIFDLGSESPADELEKLLAELRDLGPQQDKAIADLESRMDEEKHPPGFFA